MALAPERARAFFIQMETLTQKKIEKENYHSFNILANVNSLKFDLENYGYVLPETREQVCNEQLSFITEGIDRASRTSFKLKRVNGELAYFNEAKWRPYAEMIEAGLDAARHDASIDSRCEFLVGWAEKDRYHFEQIQKLIPGERHIWINAYPEDIEQKYGPGFLASRGMNPERKMGYVYQASCLEDGSICLESQTLDKSDEDAMYSIMDALAKNDALSLDDLVEVHDLTLSTKYGGRFYAGRSEAERYENAWKTVSSNSDLVEYLLNGLEAIAAGRNDYVELEKATKRHIYGVWALMKKRLDRNEGVNLKRSGVSNVYIQRQLSTEVWQAYREFVVSRKVLFGCGGSIGFDDSVLGESAADIHGAIFGSSSSKTEVMKCVTCPLCHKPGVDATIEYKGTEKIITCAKCNKSKTYKA